MIPSLTNPLVLCIVSALVLSCAVDIIVAVLTRRALSPELPPEFKNVYDAKEYARSQEYTKAKGTLGMVETVFDTSVMLAFLLCGGLAWLDTLSAGWSGNPILRGILFLGFLALAGDLLGLPFSVYHTFVLEERFGFNRSTWRTFLMDRIKGWAVGLVLGVPLLAAILWFFHAAGSAGWLYAWGATVAFLLVVQYLAPTVLLPLFNTFTPLEDGELHKRISEYARNAGFNLQGVYVMDGSRRSSKGNAFFTGFGNKKRIALFDTLIERHPCEEIVAVLATRWGITKDATSSNSLPWASSRPWPYFTCCPCCCAHRRFSRPSASRLRSTWGCFSSACSSNPFPLRSAYRQTAFPGASNAKPTLLPCGPQGAEPPSPRPCSASPRTA